MEANRTCDYCGEVEELYPPTKGGKARTKWNIERCGSCKKNKCIDTHKPINGCIVLCWSKKCPVCKIKKCVECFKRTDICSDECYKLFKKGGPDGNTIYNII